MRGPIMLNSAVAAIQNRRMRRNIAPHGRTKAKTPDFAGAACGRDNGPGRRAKRAMPSSLH